MARFTKSAALLLGAAVLIATAQENSLQQSAVKVSTSFKVNILPTCFAVLFYLYLCIL